MYAPLVATLAVLILTTSAHADGLADCSQRVDLQRTIDGCTDVLDRDTLSDRMKAMALNNRANAFAALSQMEKAMRDYKESIVIHPELAATHLNRGVTRMNTGELAAAIADFDRALEIDPTLHNAKVNRTLARLLRDRIGGFIPDISMTHGVGGSGMSPPGVRQEDATGEEDGRIRRNQRLELEAQ